MKNIEDVPQLFRLDIEVADLNAASAFYEKLLEVKGRTQRGQRRYFDECPVTASSCGLGANDRSTCWTRGAIPSVSSKQAPSTRASQKRETHDPRFQHT
jgi:hypothetical protein